MPAAIDRRVQRVAQVSINAKDLERATAFYRDRVGLKHLFTVPKMSFFDCGGTRLMVALPESPEFDHPGSVLYLETADLEGAHAAMSGEGVAFAGPPHKVADLGDRELWMAFFHDSEGNVLALTQEKPRSA